MEATYTFLGNYDISTSSENIAYSAVVCLSLK